MDETWRTSLMKKSLRLSRLIRIAFPQEVLLWLFIQLLNQPRRLVPRESLVVVVEVGPI